MNSINSCTFCGGSKFRFLFHGSDRMYEIPGKYSVNECTDCRLIFLNPQPSESELLKHYSSEEYVSLKGNSRPNLELLLTKTYLSKNWFLKLLLLPLKPKSRSSKVVPDGKFLDVGCGTGYFLELMKSFDMDCYGIEPGGFNREFAEKNGLKITQGQLADANYPDNFFDVITMNHVFEHVHNPTAVLKELYRILKPRGTLILAIPQRSSLAYKVFGRYWVSLDVPRHLFIYSTRLLKKFVQREGFLIRRTQYNSMPFQFLGSLLYWLNNFRKKKKCLSEKSFKDSKFLFVLFLPLAHLCNLLRIGDQIELVLEKSADVTRSG